MAIRDNYKAAGEMLSLADGVGGWETDDLTDKQKWAVEQYHQAAIAHAVLALVSAWGREA